jgi:hypothetical protein
VEIFSLICAIPEFDEIFGRIRQRELAFWAEPFHQQSGKINMHNGGRGVIRTVITQKLQPARMGNNQNTCEKRIIVKQSRLGSRF